MTREGVILEMAKIALCEYKGLPAWDADRVWTQQDAEYKCLWLKIARRLHEKAMENT